MKTIVVNEKFATGEYKPYPWQKELIKKLKKAQYLSIVVGRQHGKTEMIRQIILDMAYKYKKRKYPKALIVMNTIEQCVSLYGDAFNEMFQNVPSDILKVSGSGKSIRTYQIYRKETDDWFSIKLAGVDNAKTLRGGTYDIVVADEAAFFPEDVISEVLEPFLTVTQGKMILTSTVNGCEGEFYTKSMAYQKYSQREDDDGKHVFIYHTAQDLIGQVWDQKHFDYMAERAKEEKTYWKFCKEYLNDWFASPADERPFAMKLSALRADKTRLFEEIKGAERSYLKSIPLYVSMDIGKRGNMATFFWRKLGGRLQIIDYEDDFNGITELIDYSMKKHAGDYHNVTLIFPSDVAQPAIFEGDTNLDQIRKYIRNNGWVNKIKITARPKVVNKKVLWDQAIQRFERFFWCIGATAKSYGKLAGCRFKRDNKTGYIDYGNVVKNDNQHAADAFLYLVDHATSGADISGEFVITEKKRYARQVKTYKYRKRDS